MACCWGLALGLTRGISNCLTTTPLLSADLNKNYLFPLACEEVFALLTSCVSYYNSSSVITSYKLFATA